MLTRRSRTSRVPAARRGGERGNRMEPDDRLPGRIAARARRSAGLRASPTANPVGAMRPGRFLAVPTTDLSSPEPWLESRARSRARRVEAARRLRRLRGRRAVAVMALSLDPRRRRRWPRERDRRHAPGRAHLGVGRRAPARARHHRRRHLRPADAPRRARFQRANGLTVDGIAGAADAGRARPHGAQKRPLGAARRRVGGARADRAVRVGRRPDGGLGRRPLPRQVPVLARHVARAWAAPATPPQRREAEQDAAPPRCSRHAAPRPGRTARASSGRERDAGPRAAPLPIAQSQRSRLGASRIRSTRAGAPATTALSGTSLVTTVEVPTIALSPTVTPRRMQAP